MRISFIVLRKSHFSSLSERNKPMEITQLEDNYFKLRQLDLFYDLLNMEAEARTLNVNAVCHPSLRLEKERVGEVHRRLPRSKTRSHPSSEAQRGVAAVSGTPPDSLQLSRMGLRIDLAQISDSLDASWVPANRTAAAFPVCHHTFMKGVL